MNPTRNVGAPSPFPDSGAVSQSMHVNSQSQLVSQSQNLTLIGSQVTGHFQRLEPAQGQASAQPRFAQGQVVQAQSKSQAAHVQFQVQQQGQGQGQGAQSHIHTRSQGGSGNVGVVSPPVQTPATASAAKRSSQRPASKPQASSNTNVGSLLKTMELAPTACRKKRKLPENKIPYRVTQLLPESALYTRLLEYEARVDAALSRKKLDITEYCKNPPHFQKTLRIYVFNTFAHQAQTSLGSVNSEAAPSPSWTLKIMGKILDDRSGSSSSEMVHKHHLSVNQKFSSFFKKITIYLDQSLYPDNHVIVWENSRSATHHEGFEVKRKGNKEFTAIIRLELNCVPEKFKLSTALSQVLGIDIETRAKVVIALWQYVKFRRLQDPNDPAIFTCDPPLRKLFGEEKMKFTAASQKLSQHLSPLQPLHFEHRIKLSGNGPSGNTCYDVGVDVPFPLQQEMSSFLNSIEKRQDIDAFDDTISAAIKKIHEHHRRRAFFLGFSQSPAEFVNTLVASQNRDLKAFVGDAVRNAEKEGRSEFFNQSWVEDAVIQYLNRKTATGVDSSKAT